MHPTESDPIRLNPTQSQQKIFRRYMHDLHHLLYAAPAARMPTRLNFLHPLPIPS
jgi:hypothetical protein